MVETAGAATTAGGTAGAEPAGATTGKITVRPATAADIAAFRGIAEAAIPTDMPTPTLIAWVGEIVTETEPRLLGLGGFAVLRGHYRAFCDLTQEARAYRMTLMRAAKRVMAEARRRGIRHVYAEPQADQPGAKRWLESLGFQPDPRSAGTLYRWQS